MRVAMFYHSLVSDWNHGNAHFLRGIATELLDRGHEVRVFEPIASWSAVNLLKDHGVEPFQEFHTAYPQLSTRFYSPGDADLDEMLEGADLVLVHEWNQPELVRSIGQHRSRHGGYKLLFHDTHHRMATKPEEMSQFDLSSYDGVLAFGEVIAALYRAKGQRAWVWHEAADVRVFRPLDRGKQGDLVWIGNWGDDERTAELGEFLIAPATELRLKTRIHGVRYPESVLENLGRLGIQYAGWIANFKVPEVFARFRLTVHVPRRPYTEALPGVPTIRVFEALASGIPLISAPWDDRERLFTPGEDFLVARNGREMRDHMKRILLDPEFARDLAARGRETILARHTCAHRVDELLEIFDSLEAPPRRRTQLMEDLLWQRI